jgi:hypothetical protein
MMQVYELLRRLTSNTVDLQHWQSGIRHFVQAHVQYSSVTKWGRREIADIMYKDQNNLLGRTLQSKIIGDAFQDWWPDWLEDLGDDEDQVRRTSAVTELPPLNPQDTVSWQVLMHPRIPLNGYSKSKPPSDHARRTSL